ncbi:L domain-like protein [Byssothecium circinans]|uniref:L domain-like protein n=1 Tax=Byssothecium circinans TaxID=147558 RepID=A0A6A5U738_9PLEO|nr:L domain-like protein [Byssothecium circinans]
MEQPSGIPVRSGIPRPTSSRLPVLRPSGSQSQLRPPTSTSAEPLRKKPSLSSISRPSQPAPSLQKKTSRTSLSRSNTSSTSTATNTGSTRASLYSTSTKRTLPTTGQARASISNANAPIFKKPIGRPAPQPTRASNTEREDDALGELDGFRSASRASSRASSRAGFRDAEPEYAYPGLRQVRPSLAERTIESLSHLPSSPAGKGRRRSSFFNADNSMPPPLRPASALSNGRRPTTSDGTPHATVATPRKGAPLNSRISMTAPGKRSSSATTLPSAPGTPSKTPSIGRLNSTIKKQPLSQMHNVQAVPKPRPLSNSKTMVARTPKARPSLAGTFGQAISPPGTIAATTPSPARRESVVKATPVTGRKVSNSSAALRERLAKAKTTTKPGVAPKQPETPPKGNASQTLREQIAKAKQAARRADSTHKPRAITPPRDAIVPDPIEIAEFDFGLDDPFNHGLKGSKSLLRKRIDAGRVDGRLNIAAMGLKEVPEDVLRMYKYDPSDTTVAWGEIVDLTVIIAADNEFESLTDTMFPDIDIAHTMDSDEDDGPVFGAIQNFDLHGNVLRGLPMGMRHLTQLSKLNLSRNKLSLDVLDVVCQITSLRDLKLAENALEGSFPPSVGSLTQLEILEIQGNKLTSLPSEMRALAHLRTLNVSDNKLKALPTELFTEVPIIELIATKNAFSGAFFDIDTVPHLQNLQLANNSLTTFCESGTVLLPALKYLDLSGNRLSALSDMSSWTSLTTLLMGYNKLSSLPEGFLSLQTLRNADFTSNDLNKLDERIALMEGLENITLAANPLRERKFLSMTTADLKRDLLSRVQPDLVEETPEILGEVSGEGTGWELTPSGKLDLSFQNLTDLDDEMVVTFAETNDIRQLYVASNYLTSIPAVTMQLSFLSVLDLSKNNISVPLSEPLELTKLRELRLGANKIESLDSIVSLLSAPRLHHLDVSNNRISGLLPPLRDFFPELLLFIASENRISEVSAESLRGLKAVNLSNNDIARLEPEIGQYAGTLTSLEVSGNRFRVPSHAMLKKGTEAVLSWLRDKIPAPADDFHLGSPGSPSF